jgi:two-component system LytT family response regulator
LRQSYYLSSYTILNSFMLKVLIADDEENVREALAQIITSYGSAIEIVAASDGVESTVKAIHQHKPDVILLDIQMKDGTGFDVLKHFPFPQFKIIFITAYQEYAVQAFRFSALDYLLKPVDPDLLIETLKKTADIIDREKISLKIDSFLYNMNSLSKGAKKVILKTSENIHVVNMQDIMYCEAERSYTNFYMNDATRILVSSTLGHYEEIFEGYGFLRIHQSYLLNINYIKRYRKGDGGNVILTNSTSLPVATRKKDQLLQLLAKL